MSTADPDQPDGAALLTSAVRRRIMDTLAALPRLTVEGRPTRDGGLSAAELGERLDLHSTTVRFHLDQLVGAGLVDSHFVRDGGAGRPKKKYVIVEGDLSQVVRPDAAGPYRVLATLLADALDPATATEVTPEQAGIDWVRRRLAEQRAADGDQREGTPERAGTTGQWLGKVGGVVDLLEEWGYTPDLTLDGAEGDLILTLRDCPFLDLARAHPAVVCGVHRGLLKGALQEAGEEQAEVSLRPFVGPATCHAVVVRDASTKSVVGLALPGDRDPETTATDMSSDSDEEIS
ncbi:helix-turn-helix transcriptional regulator [Ornithinimicrobium sp. Y1847]|uniref:helix-turn-helix transcriptional regulator n=1 Tax=Ornithinimicrobium sp. Y1847 TaxID=3405419 RepID=UPI003B67E1FA